MNSIVFGTGGGGGDIWFSLILMVGLFALMYFFMIRPQNKKRKQEEAMRKALDVGDNIVTIGGIVGRIVGIKEETDTIIVETGADRNKLYLKRWAIAGPDGKEIKKDEK
jgi:preprotein translocase subunit YajC